MQKEEKSDTTSWVGYKVKFWGSWEVLPKNCCATYQEPDSSRKVKKETEMLKCKQVWWFKSCYLDVIH